MCYEVIHRFAWRHEKRLEMCEHRRKASESCWYSCFGSGRCEGRGRPKHIIKPTPCHNCVARGQARQVRQPQGPGRDSYMDPSLGKALVGMPGSEFNAYNPHHCQARANNVPPYHQQRVNNRPVPQAIKQAKCPAQPVRPLPKIHDRPTKTINAQKPQVHPGYHAIQPMSAAVERMPSSRAPLPLKTVNSGKPQVVQVAHQAQFHRPQVAQVVQPQMAHIVNPHVVYDQRLRRRNSDGVSELGSDDGDEPGWISSTFLLPNSTTSDKWSRARS